MAGTEDRTADQRRRTPVQRRSRGRVQDILTATGQLLGEGGVDAVTTRALAERANISVAAVYQYFPNRDAIIDAYLEAATSRIDASVFEAVLGLSVVSARSVVETAVLAHLRFYQENPDLVRVWRSSRTDSVVLSRARERNVALAHWLRDAFLAAGFLREDFPAWGTAFIVQVCESAIEFVFTGTHSAGEQEDIVRMGIEMVLSQIEPYLTERALTGVPAAEFAASLAQAVGTAADA